MTPKYKCLYEITGCIDDVATFLVPINELPQQRTWVGLMRGVRVEGDNVIISVHYGNDAARQVCGALIKEMNT